MISDIKMYSFFNKIINKIKFYHYLNKSYKLVRLYKKIYKNEIFIYDIGAGQRILPEILNFNGISKIVLVDPNKNIQYTYNRLLKYFKNINDLIPIKFGISDKTKFIDYFEAHRSTGSTFVDMKKNQPLKKKFYIKNSIKLKTYSFSDLVKKFRLKKPDIIKIDVEGYEKKVIKSVLQHSNPLIIQIETNMNNPFFDETFSEINELINSKKYFLNTLIPSYGSYDSKEKKIFNKTKKTKIFDYEYKLAKNELFQAECYYIKKKNFYTINELICLSGFGFIDYFEKQLEINKKRYKKNESRILQEILLTQKNI